MFGYLYGYLLRLGHDILLYGQKRCNSVIISASYIYMFPYYCMGKYKTLKLKFIKFDKRSHYFRIYIFSSCNI